MKNQYHEILQGLSADELRLDMDGRQAVKACAELMLNMSVDFATATSLATLLAAHLKRIEPTEDFAEGFEENTPAYYSSEVAYVAFFLLYLCEKIRSIDDILAEKGNGFMCTHFLPKCAGDADVCDRCAEKVGRAIPIEQVAYDNVPPYHMGCRCRPLLMKEAAANAAQGT
ncbi:MAG: hypothetical protein PHI98_01350 [Eubacteriales bacterium]|nr:hypothetical protein [Eubacteriales bacterium]